MTSLKQLVTLDGAPEPDTPQELIERLVNGGRTLKQMYDSIVQDARAKQRQEVNATHNHRPDVRDAGDFFGAQSAGAASGSTLAASGNQIVIGSRADSGAQASEGPNASIGANGGQGVSLPAQQEASVESLASFAASKPPVSTNALQQPLLALVNQLAQKASTTPQGKAQADQLLKLV